MRWPSCRARARRRFGAAPTLAALRVQPLPTVLPADLLGRRADLVAQRWRVDAALRDIDLARASSTPNVNLVAFVGLSSMGLDRLSRPARAPSAPAPALRLPVFDGGRLRAQLGEAQAEADAAVEAYNTTLLRALREVADEVATCSRCERQQRAHSRGHRSGRPPPTRWRRSATRPAWAIFLSC
jgi:outer membrane protein TolC